MQQYQGYHRFFDQDLYLKINPNMGDVPNAAVPRVPLVFPSTFVSYSLSKYGRCTKCSSTKGTIGFSINICVL